MLAVNYSTIRNRLKDYCDRVTDENETVIVTRKDEKNVVIISLDEYNALTKAVRNLVRKRKASRWRYFIVMPSLDSHIHLILKRTPIALDQRHSGHGQEI